MGDALTDHDRLIRIDERVIRVDQRTELMYHALFGTDGRGGVVSDVQELNRIVEGMRDTVPSKREKYGTITAVVTAVVLGVFAAFKGGG